MSQTQSNIESCEGECSMPEVTDTVAQLKNWTASSVEEFDAVKSEREYKLSSLPNWTCIICEKAISSPFSPFVCSVNQCRQGHLACSKCSRRGVSCKECSNPLSSIKNTAVEEMMILTTATCKFATLGCTEVVQYRELLNGISKHEKSCSFAPVVCRMPKCHRVGLKNLLSQHLLNEHSIKFAVDLKYSDGYSQSDNFELDSSTDLIVLWEIATYSEDSSACEVYLMHQESTRSDDILYISSLKKNSERQYRLEVKVNKNVTFILESNDRQQEEPRLVIPKEPSARPLKKDCVFETWE